MMITSHRCFFSYHQRILSRFCSCYCWNRKYSSIPIILLSLLMWLILSNVCYSRGNMLDHSFHFFLLLCYSLFKSLVVTLLVLKLSFYSYYYDVQKYLSSCPITQETVIVDLDHDQILISRHHQQHQHLPESMLLNVLIIRLLETTFRSDSIHSKKDS